MRLADKVAVITGAGSGIGRAIADLFAQQGAKVLIGELDEPAGRAAAEAITAAGGTAVFQAADVAREDDCRNLASTAVNRFGAIHILVNNAAAFVFRKIEDATMDDWQRVLGVNVIGPANCVRFAAPAMRAAGGGAIVNIASVSSFIAQPGFVPYNTSKGALLQLTRCLAMDLAADNIRVNSICPGEIHTAATDRHISYLGIDREQALIKLANQAVLRRVGQPHEVAAAALFLASDEASFITGATLVVDGGATID